MSGDLFAPGQGVGKDVNLHSFTVDSGAILLKISDLSLIRETMLH